MCDLSGLLQEEERRGLELDRRLATLRMALSQQQSRLEHEVELWAGVCAAQERQAREMRDQQEAAELLALTLQQLAEGAPTVSNAEGSDRRQRMGRDCAALLSEARGLEAGLADALAGDAQGLAKRASGVAAAARDAGAALEARQQALAAAVRTKEAAALSHAALANELRALSDRAATLAAERGGLEASLAALSTELLATGSSVQETRLAWASEAAVLGEARRDACVRCEAAGAEAAEAGARATGLRASLAAQEALGEELARAVSSLERSAGEAAGRVAVLRAAAREGAGQRAELAVGVQAARHESAVQSRLRAKIRPADRSAEGAILASTLELESGNALLRAEVEGVSSQLEGRAGSRDAEEAQRGPGAMRARLAALAEDRALQAARTASMRLSSEAAERALETRAEEAAACERQRAVRTYTSPSPLALICCRTAARRWPRLQPGARRRRLRWLGAGRSWGARQRRWGRPWWRPRRRWTGRRRLGRSGRGPLRRGAASGGSARPLSGESP